MKLQVRINLIVGVLTLLFVLGLLAVQLQGLRGSVNEEVVAANRVASQLLNRIVWGYAPRGPAAVKDFLQGLGRLRANDITLLDDQGATAYRSPPSPYKAGRDAPDWFVRLLAPPPQVQAMSFPGGRLEVRADASRAVLDAWDDLSANALASLGLVLLLNLLVLWLVGRAVRPFPQIVHALNQLEAGRFDAALPPLRGSEAAAIGAAFNRMVAQLQDHVATERRAARAERELSDSRDLARWLDHHIEKERKLIARELHDELGQSVTGMRSMALSIAQRVAPLDATAEKAARLIAEESSRLYDAMHGLIPRLAPMVLDTLGLAAALKDLAERTQRSQPGLKLALHLQLAGLELPTDVTLCLYRAAQEGITNALRHGQAQHLALSLHAGPEPGQVTLRLLDDGRGLPLPAARPMPTAPGLPSSTPPILPPATPSGHYGLRWLGERVHSLGGTLALEPAQPQGVLLTVQLPAALEPGADA